MRFVKIPGILSTAPDLICVVIRKRHRENAETISLFTWHISMWPNCGFWSIVAFIFWVTLKSVAILSVTQKIESHNRPKNTIRPQWNVPCKKAKWVLLSYNWSFDGILAAALHFDVCVTWQSHEGLRQQQQINFAEETVLTRFTTIIIIIWEIMQSEVMANYLFSKYRLQALIFKIPAFYRPLLN